MRPHRLSLAALLPVLALGALVACWGGGGGGSTVRNPSDVPTATAPATLPTPVIVSGASTPATGGGQTYTVEDGDNPSSIAAQFDITTEELMAANGITDPTGLYVGQVLTIPSNSNVLGSTEEPEPTPVTPEAPEPTQAQPTPASGQQVYIVQDGDIPETIAAQFGITADELMAANGITDPTSLQVGQELIIPEPSQ